MEHILVQTTAHTIQNATHAGLILAGADEYGVPEWIGTSDQWYEFRCLENDPNLL